MALPFIVGPHQCSLTHGPDGRPQVEIISRIRLPLAEFFDALLMSLADQSLLFPQPEFGTAQASMASFFNFRLAKGLQTVLAATHPVETRCETPSLYTSTAKKRGEGQNRS